MQRHFFQSSIRIFGFFDTHNLDAEKVDKMITPNTTGIIGVHVWGRPCNIEALSELAARRNLKLLFDAAHAFGCSAQGQPIGNFGDAEVFSFHATKFLNTFEGGAVTTNDDELAQKIRLMKNFGFKGFDNVVYIGTNGKMSEASAAMGLTSLDSMDRFVAVNRSNYDAYAETLQGIDGIKLIRYDTKEAGNFQYIILEVDESKTGLSRNDLVKVLHAENVIARRYFYPGSHRMEPYRSNFPHAHLLLQRTEALTEQVMSLPNGTAIGPEDIEKIGAIIRLALDRSVAVRERLHEANPV